MLYNLPTQTPVPIIGGFMTHFNGGSHVPENPPGPPHASPSVRAHILQHLKRKKTTNQKIDP